MMMMMLCGNTLKLQLDSEAYETQTKEVNKHDHSISSGPSCHAEKEYIKSGLLAIRLL